ncbi:MAG: asparagine synthase (glutamine-hydrolyzing) [Pseudomonadota bacterium]
MCGICGILHAHSAYNVQASVLEAMNETMRHRGPDDAGVYVKGSTGLAMRRLSIIDVAGGHQPLANEDGSIQAILNGEIYNYKELREELEAHGHHFKTNSDTEVLPHLYEELGEDCIDKLNGMFGLAIWDEKKRKLILARDRIGKKPLYYTMQNTLLLFASELKAICAHPEIKREIDAISLSKYLAYEYVPAPRTIFRNIFKLEEGHILIWEDGKTTKKQYWNIPVREFERIKLTDAQDSLKDLLYCSVKRRLMSDVPLGVFLSGGIDSSIITYLMSTILPPEQIKTFSIGFSEKSFDESSYARLVASHFGTDHHEQECSAQDLLSLLPEVQNFLDEPLGDSSIIPTYALSKFTRQHVTVALGGDGGDELFAGYPTFIADNYAKYYRFVPGLIRNNIVRPLVAKLPVNDDNISFDFKVKQFVKGAGLKEAERHFIWIGSFSPKELEKLFGVKQMIDVFDNVKHHLKIAHTASPGNQLLYLYNKLYLNEDILVKVDRASMGCSLEVRAPFLDYHVVDFVSRLPYSMKLHGSTMKYLLKKTFGHILPPGVANRPKKGFGIPVAKWLKGPLKQMAQDLLHPAKIKAEGFFDPNEVARLLTDHLSNKVDNRKKLWTLMMFEMWLERWGK